MFACYYCQQRWMAYQIWWVTAKVNTELSENFSFRNFIKTKNTYQSINLKYPVSEFPDNCHIYLQNGKCIFRVCESPDKGTTEVHSSYTQHTKLTHSPLSTTCHLIWPIRSHIWSIISQLTCKFDNNLN